MLYSRMRRRISGSVVQAEWEKAQGEDAAIGGRAIERMEKRADRDANCKVLVVMNVMPGERRESLGGRVVVDEVVIDRPCLAARQMLTTAPWLLTSDRK